MQLRVRNSGSRPLGFGEGSRIHGSWGAGVGESGGLLYDNLSTIPHGNFGRSLPDRNHPNPIENADLHYYSEFGLAPPRK